MSRDDEGGVLADVAGCLLGAGLYDEGAEAAKIHVLSMCEAFFHNGHELLDHRENRGLVDASCLGYLVNYICFSHIVLNLMSF